MFTSVLVISLNCLAATCSGRTYGRASAPWPRPLGPEVGFYYVVGEIFLWHMSHKPVSREFACEWQFNGLPTFRPSALRSTLDERNGDLASIESRKALHFSGNRIAYFAALLPMHTFGPDNEHKTPPCDSVHSFLESTIHEPGSTRHTADRLHD